MRHDNGHLLALGSVAALAGLAALGRRGSRASMGVDDLIALVSELRMRWINEDDGEDYDDPDFVEGFDLSDHPHIPAATRRWWEQITGTRYLGHGNYRVVFDLGNGQVIKLALDHHGEGENQREVDAWNEYAGTSIARFLVPMIEGDEQAVVMEKARGLSSKMLSRDSALEARLSATSDELNRLAHAGEHEIMDIASPANWGIHQGQVKLIDYPMEGY